MTELKINISRVAIEEFCKKNHIQKLSFFGSVLNDSFGDDSDVDVLVEFEPGHIPGLSLIRMQDELSELFDGRRVDLVTSKSLNLRIRDRVLSQALVQYVQG